MMAHESHYAGFSSAGHPAMQSFESNQELFGLQGGMEMLGATSKHQTSNLWRGFMPRDFPEASSKNLMVTTEMVASASPWQVDDSSLRSLFPCEETEQSNRGLSLSLFNPKNSDAIGVPQACYQSDSRDVLLSRAASSHQQQVFMQEGRGFNPQQPFQLKNSKYLGPAKELLNEFCNLGAEISSKKRSQKASQWEEGGPSSSSSSWNRNQPLNSMDLLELQRRKAKLLAMLEEVDRRYRKYCDQMRAVVSSFEAVAREGAATVYSTLASKAMSRHFRCLRDGIVGQIRATRKAIGEKDTVAPGTTRGETPRLKLVDQCIRQQKAFQQAGMLDGHPWRPQRGLPERSVSILRAWLFEHFLHPYPNDVDKHILARQTGLSRSQVSNWFINARVRLWKPMVEDMYLEEVKEQNSQSSNATTTGQQDNTNRKPNPDPVLDQKPAPVQLLNDSDSLSSIINSSHQSDPKNTANARASQHHTQQHQVPRAESFGVASLDFPYGSCGSQNLGGGVSLTLGLQQHSGGGMSLSFSPASQHSLLFSREHIDDDGQQVQFTILDGEAQTLPYRNMMGAQLLHDLAG
ncbi:homeobox protein BEL1 homolog [Elaeis guineensis]|uniref:Homeobox protein BEL1 homolog n=1 Tax=Elaeis guineensis var. tenera TaxID=51953 RepID=A0A6I9S031_ELAGV|nr:homeobox protein BEL1 homolog [Elaeis guineensis]